MKEEERGEPRSGPASAKAPRIRYSGSGRDHTRGRGLLGKGGHSEVENKMS